MPGMKRKAVSNSKSKENKPNQKKKNGNDVDTKLYEVSEVLDQRQKGNQIYYTISWKEYPHSDNSLASENRLLCPNLLQQFSKATLRENYMEELDELKTSLANLNKVEFLNKVNPLTIIGSNFITQGMFHFMSADSIGAKKMFITSVFKYKSEWMLKSIIRCSEEEVTKDLKQYWKELSFRISATTDYPVVNIILPEYKHFDAITQPPPPHSNLIFEPIYSIKESIENHVIVQKSSKLGFDKTPVFVDENFFTKIDKKTHLNNPRYSHIALGSQVPNYKNDPRFYTNLALDSSAYHMGWILRNGEENVSPDVPLIQMTGVIVDKSEAKYSLLNDGDLIAFTSFISIENTGKCLDRRVYYDFSKFIKHSCDPNCAVRLVKSIRPEPDLVVYSKKALRAHEALTLDYFVGFHDELDKFFESLTDPILNEENGRLLYLQENNIDHIVCSCNSPICRTILFANQSKVKSNKNMEKRDQLNQIYNLWKFGGINLTVDKKIYDIKNGEFVEK